MRKRNLVLIPLISLLASAAIVGSAFAAWATSEGPVDNAVRVEIQDWDFGELTDSAHYENVPSDRLVNLSVSQETEILADTAHSTEAIRLTNTYGYSNKRVDHSVNIDLYTGKPAGQNYFTVGEIAIKKVEFDYYHAEKRQQAGKGYPKVALLYNNSRVGNEYGGGESISPTSVYLSTDSEDGKWWHLEYFITALCPTFADHGDSGIATTKKINGVKIYDDAIYDLDEDTQAFVVIDNLKITATSSTRLGLFNRSPEFKVNNYYWMKIAWSGELQYCNITFTDLDGNPTDEYADYTPSEKSKFYIYGKKVGSFIATATLIVGGGQPLTISNKLTIKNG